MARKKPVPTDPKTLAQMYHRWLYQDYAAYWHTLTAEQKQVWEVNARRLKITGFNYWMRDRLTTLPDIELGLHLDSALFSTAIDFSPNSNDGTIYGAGVVDGVIDHAFDFDGIDDRILIPAHASINFGTGPFTLEAIFNWYGKGTSNYHNIFRKGDAEGYLLRINPEPVLANTVIQTYVGGTGVTFTWYDPGVKHHIALIRNSDGDLRIVLDGVTRASVNAPNDCDTAHDLRIGARAAATMEPYWGLLDEIRISNRELTNSDCLRHSERRYPL